MYVKKKSDSYHHGDLRRSLLHAAFTILRNDGPSALSLREVAREAGVSHQAPYHHFPSRVHLLAALATEGFEQLAHALETTQAAAIDSVLGCSGRGSPTSCLLPKTRNDSV